MKPASNPAKPASLLLAGYRRKDCVTGRSAAFDMLLSGLGERGIAYRFEEIAALESGIRAGGFHPGIAARTVGFLIRFWRGLISTGIVYFPIASSLPGFIRDALMIWPAWLSGRRIVLHLHGGGYEDFYNRRTQPVKTMIRTTLSRADTIVVLGEGLRAQFGFVPHSSEKLRVVPNGLPPDLEPDFTSLKSIPLDRPIRLLYLSNMIESKGYPDVLEACRILKKSGVSFRCDFCGEFVRTAVDHTDRTIEASKAYFLRRIRENHLEEDVKYHGVVRGVKKQLLLEQAHFFLLPTTYPWEGQPISIIEALAFGIPVIATRHRGIPEQIIDGYNGFFVEPRSPVRIAEIIRLLHGNPGVYETVSRNATAHFLRNYTHETHVMKLISAIFGQEASKFTGRDSNPG